MSDTGSRPRRSKSRPARSVDNDLGVVCRVVTCSGHNVMTSVDTELDGKHKCNKTNDFWGVG